VLVGEAAGEEGLDALLVVGVALALEVGPAGAFAGAGGVAGEGAFVPVEAEPAEAAQDDIDGFLGVAGGIGVLDAEDEGAAGVASVEPVEEGGAGASDVEVAGGRGGKADARFHGHDVGLQMNIDGGGGELKKEALHG